jgi:tetratricopeptide (TPR) repeat protein
MTRITTTIIFLALVSAPATAQHVAAGDDSGQQNLVGGVKSDVSAIDKTPDLTKPLPGEELFRLFAMYDDARAAGAREEADTIGKQIVETSIRTYGMDSWHTADALTNLGTLQTSNEEHEAAIKNFEAAIGILERTDSMLSKDLIRPLRAMGSAQLQAGRPHESRDTWNRAVHISHVNYGPNNVEQVETLRDLARLYSRAGMSKEAGKIRMRIYHLRSRSYYQGT